jgi:FkbM family methyltransferase
MSDKNKLIEKLNVVEAFATTSKFKRFLYNPFKYFISILYSKILNRYFNFHSKFITTTFWGKKFQIEFPSAIDIFLSGGKTHNSEIRLAKFLINNLKENSILIDIGAHFGFFSVLASELIKSGKIFSIEPSQNTFKILKFNTSNSNLISVNNIAISDIDSEIHFYEYATLFSEFNTLVKNQYSKEDWYNEKIVTISKIQCKKGDTFVLENDIIPDFIKIDVEGAEDKVIFGFFNLLSKYSPTLIMEFAHSNRNNTNHIIADSELKKLGYRSYLIKNNGEIELIKNYTNEYVSSLNLESDNIVYIKK